MKIRSLLSASFILFGVSTSAIALPFSNGSFETGPSNVGSFTTLSAGDTSIAGWSISGGSVDYIGSYWTAQQGQFSLDLSGNSQSAVSQTFDTQVGQAYRVSFFLSGNPAGEPAVKGLDVSAGATSASYSFDSSGQTLPGITWIEQSFLFTASAASTTLTFASALSFESPYGPALDNVTVSAVPEPATWAMMVLGFAGVAGMAYRRSRRRGDELAPGVR